MFIVKAKSAGDSYGPDIPGGDNLRWIEGQTRLIHEGVISYYRSNPTAWEIVDNDESLVRSAANPVTGGITKIWTGTQAEYDALTPADDTLYIIVEA